MIISRLVRNATITSSPSCPIARYAKTVAIAGQALLGLLCLTPVGVAADQPANGVSKVYKYTVHHPSHGNIGTYVNTIRKHGAEVVVNNKISISVKFFEFVIHEHNSENTARWRDGRIVSFKGTTRINDETFKVDGYADGEKFIVVGPEGQSVAPSGVFPTNPWSTGILDARVLMGAKSGSLYRVRASAGERKLLKLGSKTVQTKFFKVDGEVKFELWFDESGQAVQFRDLSEDGGVTFQLVQEGDSQNRSVIKGSIAGP